MLLSRFCGWFFWFLIKCLTSGPGILNSSEPTLSWNTSLMDTGTKYEILVIIKKDIRNGNFSLILELKAGDPPQVVIRWGDLSQRSVWLTLTVKEIFTSF